ncbi:MAG: class I SAM-dependent methyltransferase [Firmicutes bacterium]|nr:class I SAM-dependent methyltransferase [Bacillota bacterium]
MKSVLNWRDYEILASGDGEKLERWGDVFLLRPDPQAIWSAPYDMSKFKDLHARYNRSSSGGGAWKILKPFPEEWTIKYPGRHGDLRFLISPTGFKHTGLFPEQGLNWDRVMDVIAGAKKSGRSPRVLNLFGYTGGATVAASKVGAHTTHVDASKGMTEVAKRNCVLNKIPNELTRFIIEDCVAFVSREIRRGKTYDAIIMDPPSFGRGANGEVWKIETCLENLIDLCMSVLSEKPLFILVNSYTTGLQPTVIGNVVERCLSRAKKRATIDCYEIGIGTHEGITLPAGASCFVDNF